MRLSTGLESRQLCLRPAPPTKHAFSYEVEKASSLQTHPMFLGLSCVELGGSSVQPEVNIPDLLVEAKVHWELTMYVVCVCVCGGVGGDSHRCLTLGGALSLQRPLPRCHG